MKILRWIEGLIIKTNMIVIVISLSAMIILGFIQIILRNFFGSGLAWIDIIIRSLVMWAAFTGAVVATPKGQHIAIGALTKFVPKKLERSIEALTSLVTSAVCVLLVHASIRFVAAEKETGVFLVGQLPLWTTELIIPATFCFLAYLFLLEGLSGRPKEGL